MTLVAAVLAATSVVVGSELSGGPGHSDRIGGPYASLLAAASDLGSADERRVQLTAALRDGLPPRGLDGWARRNSLELRWRTGDRWAIVEGPATAVADALAVDVRDYRHRSGKVFYASPQQPVVPPPLQGEVSGFGRILGYTPYRESSRWHHPLEVPGQGLSPQNLLRTYNIAPMHDAGFTGKGTTVIVFAFDGFDQSDLDMFAETFGLPKFTPDVVGERLPPRSGEANMDLQAIHAIAPAAKKVLVQRAPDRRG